LVAIPFAAGAQTGIPELKAPVPAGTGEVRISFVHGKGANVEVILERQRP